MTTIAYLVNRLFYRITDFLRRWYIKSFFVYAHIMVSALGRLDETFALKITARHLFEPLYQDKSIIGYVLGFVFRSIRILVAFFIYAILVVFFTLVYVAWLAVPIFLIYQAIFYGK